MPHAPNKNNKRWTIPDQLTSQEKHERFALHFPAQLTQINDGNLDVHAAQHYWIINSVSCEEMTVSYTWCLMNVGAGTLIL